MVLRFSSRTIVGLLLGWLVIFEGLVAFSISDIAIIEGIGGIRASTFQLAAVQLIALGVFISIMWLFRQTISGEGRKTLSTLLSILTYVAMTVVTIEGLAMVYIGGPVFIEGIGSITNEVIVLAGAQLFAVGLLSLRYWWLRDEAPVNWLVDAIGSIASALLVMEGLTVMGAAKLTNIEGIGYILSSTVFDAGLQLFIIGAVLFAMWALIKDLRTDGLLAKVLNRKNSFIIMLILGGILAVEGIIAATWAGSIDIKDGHSFSKEIVVAGCAQLFLLGLVAPLLWRVRHKEMGFDFTPNFTVPVVLSLLAFEGVFAIGISSSTIVDSIGGISGSTFLLAGQQLLALSLIGLAAWILKDVLPGVWTKRIMSSIPLFSAAVIALEGLAATLMASNIYINDLEQGISEGYVLLGGAQMVLLSALALFCWVRSEGISLKFKVTGTAAAMFVMLMLPFAIVL